MLPTEEPVLPAIEPVLPAVEPVLPAVEPVLPAVELVLPAVEPVLSSVDLVLPSVESELATVESVLATVDSVLASVDLVFATVDSELEPTKFVEVLSDEVGFFTLPPSPITGVLELWSPGTTSSAPSVYVYVVWLSLALGSLISSSSALGTSYLTSSAYAVFC